MSKFDDRVKQILNETGDDTQPAPVNQSTPVETESITLNATLTKLIQELQALENNPAVLNNDPILKSIKSAIESLNYALTVTTPKSSTQG